MRVDSNVTTQHRPADDQMMCHVAGNCIVFPISSEKQRNTLNRTSEFFSNRCKANLDCCSGCGYEVMFRMFQIEYWETMHNGLDFRTEKQFHVRKGNVWLEWSSVFDIIIETSQEYDLLLELQWTSGAEGKPSSGGGRESENVLGIILTLRPH